MLLQRGGNSHLPSPGASLDLPVQRGTGARSWVTESAGVGMYTLPKHFQPPGPPPSITLDPAPNIHHSRSPLCIPLMPCRPTANPLPPLPSSPSASPARPRIQEKSHFPCEKLISLQTFPPPSSVFTRECWVLRSCCFHWTSETPCLGDVPEHGNAPLDLFGDK